MMTGQDIAHHRLFNQHLAGTPLDTPANAVEWLGAVQSQDYAGAKWAVGQRTDGLTDSALDQAFNDGLILRTHVMRPTWHFVTPSDIRWILALTGPRVHATVASYYRQQGLDDNVFKQCHAILIKALQGGKQLTRTELGARLQAAGVPTINTLRLSYIIMHAELEAIICSGLRRGKQFTYMLLDERAPDAKTLSRDESLAELTRRYFTSHGPATVRDFVWWSGLTTADARAALHMLGSTMTHAVVDGKTYWFSAAMPPVKDRRLTGQTAYLLPNYDEYTVAYKDRSALFELSSIKESDLQGASVLAHTLVIDGRMVGTWKRTINKSDGLVEAKLFAPLTASESDSVARAVQRLSAFLGVPITFQATIGVQ